MHDTEKKSMKIGLLTLGLFILVLLTTPKAVAKFTGQHKFINGSDVNCETCHVATGTELHSSAVHNWSAADVGTSPCKVCHIPNTQRSVEDYYNPSSSGGTGRYHAAAVVECTYCHGIRNGTSTDIGGLTIPLANVTEEFGEGTFEAHRPLYLRAQNASGIDTHDFLTGVNEACITCHTYAANVTVTEIPRHLNVTSTAKDCLDSDPSCELRWNVSLEMIG
ncbi:hypothetical protein [Candidatus Pyrohabitans sp.]